MFLASLSGGHTAGVEQALVALLIVAAAVAVIARRIGAPYTVGLVLVGLVLGLTSWFGDLSFSSDLVFYVFLPVLLFEAAFNLETRHLFGDWRRILALTVPGVLVAFALTAAGMRLAGGVTWAVALLFGALIAATDPVSVLALFRHIGVSERLTSLVDAESLFNDGTAAVVFAIVVAAVVEHRHVTALWAAGDFVWMAAGGLAVGLAVGFAVSALLRMLDDHLIEITLSTVVAYGSFLLAQRLHMSGVVACVAAGIVVGNFGRHRGMGPVTRVTMGTVWEYAAFVANSLIFLLIGLRIDLSGIARHLGLVVIAFVIVVVARAVAIYGYGALSRLSGAVLPLRWQHVLVWGGLRGTVALALVLSLPPDVAGRQTLEVVTFGVVLLSLVGQGLSMPWLARRLGLVGGEEPAEIARRRRALLAGFVVAHEELDRLQEAGELPRAQRADLARSIEDQEAVLLEGIGPLDDEPPEGEQERLTARLGALLAQRRRIEALRHAEVIDPGTAAELVDEIDRRVRLLGDRLACARDEDCEPDGPPQAEAGEARRT
jgi:monovalent cation:H+ antiporter, CPA1 family